VKIFNLRTVTWLSAAVVVAGLLGTAGCSSSSSSSATPSASPSAPVGTLTVKQIVLGSTQHLSQPDDIVTLGGNIWVGWQNGVGSMGEPAPSGNLNSALAEFTPSGHLVNKWVLKGKIDGMGADAAANQVIVTVNEDGNSSLYTVSSGGTVTHYTYSPSPLPHLGGTDAVSVYQGKILISASAPGAGGKAPKNAPAVFVVTLSGGTATAAPFFAINATATAANGSSSGSKVTLALTDPDSNEIAPSSSAAFAGDFMLNSQGDLQLIFSDASGTNLKVLKVSQSVDDSAWATSAKGTLYVTDSSANTVDALTGTFKPGTMYTAVTPCNANSAPAVCPPPSPTPFGANYLGTIDLTSGTVSKVTTVIGPVIPKGMIFVP
jgi:hypothetical protein